MSGSRVFWSPSSDSASGSLLLMQRLNVRPPGYGAGNHRAPPPMLSCVGTQTAPTSPPNPSTDPDGAEAEPAAQGGAGLTLHCTDMMGT